MANVALVHTQVRFDRYVSYHSRYESPFLLSLLKTPDKFLTDRYCEKIYKNDRTTTVALVTGNGYRFVVKRYNTKNLWHAIRRTVRRSRADICWRLARRLLDIGIHTPPAVALIECRAGPLRFRSYYISEYVDGVLCTEYLNTRQASSNFVAAVLKEVFQSMLNNRISHGDMKASNLLIDGERLILLDLDAAKAHMNNAQFLRAYRRDRQRLLRNWDTQQEFQQLLNRVIPHPPR